MKLKRITENSNLIRFADGSEVLFSYETPVAGRNKDGLFKSAEHYSMTTTRHINTYLREWCHINPKTVRTVPQAAIDLFVELKEDKLSL